MIPRTTYGDITYSVLDRNVVISLGLGAGCWCDQRTGNLRRVLRYDQKDYCGGSGRQACFRYDAGASRIDRRLHLSVRRHCGQKVGADEDGRFVPSYFESRDKLVSAMQFARELYQDGVIEQDIALAKLETSKEKYLQGQSAAMVFAWSGPAGLYNRIARDYDELYGEGRFLEDNRIAKLYPSADGNSYYFVDTESWSESYISANVDDEKMAAIAVCSTISIRKKAAVWCSAALRVRIMTLLMAML